jgi:hypothetical protein
VLEFETELANIISQGVCRKCLSCRGVVKGAGLQESRTDRS